MTEIKPLRGCMPISAFPMGLLWAAALILSTLSARANVYATDTKLNGSLYSITNSGSGAVNISYRLNQAATLGVTVAVWQGTNNMATISGGTAMGLNTVIWGGTNNSGAAAGPGTYSISITAAASGFTNWQQISVDTNAGNYAFHVGGLAVDNNTNSPYYGRVLLGCGFADGTSANPISGEIIRDGIYKMNADGSFADEGGFGYGGYTEDDFGNLSTNEMPPAFGAVPWRLRMGDDDRIYMLDWAGAGAIVSFDMQVTGFKIVIDDGGYFGGTLGGPHNYAGNPDLGDFKSGILNFDVTATATTNGAVWLCDSDYPNWGIWMYHLMNGQSDTNDIGSQAVTTGGDLSLVSSGGCSVDSHLDIFCAQSRNAENAVYDGMVFTNWNHGTLPPISSGINAADGTTAGQVGWGYGCGVDTTCTNDPTFESIRDAVINSRTSPTIIAFPMGPGSDDTNGSGIRLLDARDGSIVVSNLDFGQEYESAAWDNVGNLYGASASRSVWRAWSPPGGSTNTTVAVAQVILSSTLFKIDTVSAVPTGSGSADITLNFTAPGKPLPSAFTLVRSSTLNGTYAPVTGSVITGASGSYQAVFASSSTGFYKVEQTGP
jgi:hypothetical protein